MAKTQNFKSKIATRAWALSLAGYIPFGLLTVLILLKEDRNPFSILLLDMFKVWSAIILSFLGGIRWGAAISDTTSKNNIFEDYKSANTPILFFSVLPSIAALLALLLPTLYAIPALMVCFCLQGVWDSFSAMNGSLPRWMGKLRITLTILVVGAHAIVLFAVV